MLDRVLLLEPGIRIEAEKQLPSEEEYLKDHFPKFPVMPGVLMLEALFQASMWLVRVTEDFQHSIVLLKEVRGLRFAGFVEPRQVLKISSELIKREQSRATVKAQGFVEQNLVVSGRLILELSNHSDRGPLHAPRDYFTRSQSQKEFDRLRQPQPVS